MDLSSYSLEDIMLSAMKSEIDSRATYQQIAGKIKNAFLKDKINFIADEEEKHREFVETIFKNRFPDKPIEIPDKTPVPLPELKLDDENISPVEVFEKVMEAEKAANEFYLAFANRIEDDEEIRRTLQYFASMELGHYRLFELEKENMETYETFDADWPMMHVGP
ncbi:MAG: ferritin family protein [Thermoplasmata archaeon]|nr:MAG: ferritin family protein [Thermoplasmata archaeon]